MTNEDVIKELTRMRKNFDSNSVYGSYCIDCLDMAIEALKAQPERSQNTSSKQPDLETLGIKTGETCADAISRQDAIGLELTLSEVQTNLRKTPSAQSKQLKVLADVLDGCPLTQPCDKMWKSEGWCKEHCKPGQQEPDAECWLKYAEVMTSEQ